MVNVKRATLLAPAVISTVGMLLGGCIYKEKTTTAVPPPRNSSAVVITPTPAERVVAYPGGRYQLYGDSAHGYYWVWIPEGTAPPSPPPPPRISVR